MVQKVGGGKTVTTYLPTEDEFGNFNGLVDEMVAEGVGQEHGVALVTMPPRLQALNEAMAAAEANSCTSGPRARRRPPQKQIQKPLAQRIVAALITGLVYLVENTQVKRISVTEFKKRAEDDVRRDPPPTTDAAALDAEFWSSGVAARVGKEDEEVVYGADVGHTGFSKDQPFEKNWDLNRIPSILNGKAFVSSGGARRKVRLMEKTIKGIHSPFSYYGSWKSFFTIHIEDKGLYSILYLHWGAPKIWYVVAPKYAAKLEQVLKEALAGLLPAEEEACQAFLRHKRLLVHPEFLRLHKIPFLRVEQKPGQFAIIFPNAYHWGFNSGPNQGEAVNFADWRWIDVGKLSVDCNCLAYSKQRPVILMEPFVRCFQPDRYVAWLRGQEEGFPGPTLKELKALKYKSKEVRARIKELEQERRRGVLENQARSSDRGAPEPSTTCVQPNTAMPTPSSELLQQCRQCSVRLERIMAPAEGGPNPEPSNTDDTGSAPDDEDDEDVSQDVTIPWPDAFPSQPTLTLPSSRNGDDEREANNSMDGSRAPEEEDVENDGSSSDDDYEAPEPKRPKHVLDPEVVLSKNNQPAGIPSSPSSPSQQQPSVDGQEASSGSNSDADVVHCVLNAPVNDATAADADNDEGLAPEVVPARLNGDVSGDEDEMEVDPAGAVEDISQQGFLQKKPKTPTLSSSQPSSSSSSAVEQRRAASSGERIDVVQMVDTHDLADATSAAEAEDNEDGTACADATTLVTVSRQELQGMLVGMADLAAAKTQAKTQEQLQKMFDKATENLENKLNKNLEQMMKKGCAMHCPQKTSMESDGGDGDIVVAAEDVEDQGSSSNCGDEDMEVEARVVKNASQQAAIAVNLTDSSSPKSSSNAAADVDRAVEMPGSDVESPNQQSRVEEPPEVERLISNVVSVSQPMLSVALSQQQVPTIEEICLEPSETPAQQEEFVPRPGARYLLLVTDARFCRMPVVAEGRQVFMAFANISEPCLRKGKLIPASVKEFKRIQKHLPTEGHFLLEARNCLEGYGVEIFQVSIAGLAISYGAAEAVVSSPGFQEFVYKTFRLPEGFRFHGILLQGGEGDTKNVLKDKEKSIPGAPVDFADFWCRFLEHLNKIAVAFKCPVSYLGPALNTKWKNRPKRDGQDWAILLNDMVKAEFEKRCQKCDVHSCAGFMGSLNLLADLPENCWKFDRLIMPAGFQALMRNLQVCVQRLTKNQIVPVQGAPSSDAT